MPATLRKKENNEKEPPWQIAGRGGSNLFLVSGE
jgi:hypothetical protein